MPHIFAQVGAAFLGMTKISLSLLTSAFQIANKTELFTALCQNDELVGDHSLSQ
jgi:hypothetical protein